MSDNQGDEYDKWADKIIAEELTSQGDLLPPWLKYPEIQAMSIGWRMGDGEGYMIAWDKWTRQFDQEQFIEYFKKYLPIPIEWLVWVSNCFGDQDITIDFFSGGGDFKGIQWLEEKGLANFNDFKNWYSSWYDNYKEGRNKMG